MMLGSSSRVRKNGPKWFTCESQKNETVHSRVFFLVCLFIGGREMKQ